jgi:hypothetical protein
LASTSVIVDDLTLRAPPDSVIERFVAPKAERDGDRIAFAFVISSTGGGPNLVVFRGRGADGAASIARSFPIPPSFAIDADAGCSARNRLIAVGRASALAEIQVNCPQDDAGPPKVPERYITIIDAVSDRPRLAVTLRDPERSAALAVDAVVADRDGDGRDDLALRFTISGGGPPFEPGPSVSVVAVWLDRPAGPSQDRGPTAASFRALAEWATARAAHAKDAPDVPRYVAQVRELWRAVCAESPARRITTTAGAGLPVCDASHELESLGLAEVRALATDGQTLLAALALGQAERAPASRSVPHIADALKWISPRAPVATARLLRNVAAVPAMPSGHDPAWGPLAFERSGKLLVKTRAGVVRVDPDLGDETSAGTPEWKGAVSSPDGIATFSGVADDCDGPSLSAVVALGVQGERRSVALPVAPPLGERCNGGRGASIQTTPVAWGTGGLEVIADGRPLLIEPGLEKATLLATFLGQPYSQGAPRSPDGSVLVVPTEIGFWVQNGLVARLLRASELEASYVTQEHCVVSDDATHVACVHGGGVWVGTWDAPP